VTWKRIIPRRLASGILPNALPTGAWSSRSAPALSESGKPLIIRDLMWANKESIDRANLMLGDDESLTVKLSVKFSPGQRKPVKVEVGITFPVEKVKENLEDEVDELQLSMFMDKGNSEKTGEIAQKLTAEEAFG
jgi:hypothetical protein